MIRLFFSSLVAATLIFCSLHNPVYAQIKTEEVEVLSEAPSVHLSIVPIADPLDESYVLLQARVTENSLQEPQGHISYSINEASVVHCTEMHAAYIIAYLQTSCRVAAIDIVAKTVTATYTHQSVSSVASMAY